tara:strand:- start:16893 stop:17663 length:771 start_codon:yes stop_codon:yes gene_type:complete
LGITKFNFIDKKIIVTGGTRGIGEGIVKAFSQAGAKVFFLGLDTSRGEILESRLRSENLKVSFSQCDVTNEEQVKEVYKKIVDLTGRIDVLINNVGGWENQQSVLNTSLEEWEKIVSMNLRSVFLCSKQIIPVFQSQRSGRIVNISSIGSLTIEKSASSPPYIAAKAGVNALGRVLAAELAEYNVTVNTLAPSTTETERLIEVRSKEQREQMAERTLFSRLSKVEEVVNWVLFLSAPESSYLTGQTISVNGGRLMI